MESYRECSTDEGKFFECDWSVRFKLLKLAGWSDYLRVNMAYSIFYRDAWKLIASLPFAWIGGGQEEYEYHAS